MTFDEWFKKEVSSPFDPNIQVMEIAFAAGHKEGLAEFEQVVWRWRSRGAQLWIYDPEQSWLAQQSDDEIEKEPLYARKGASHD